MTEVFMLQIIPLTTIRLPNSDRRKFMCSTTQYPIKNCGGATKDEAVENLCLELLYHLRRKYNNDKE